MATDKPKKEPPLQWRPYSKGGQCAKYKMGLIVVKNGKYYAYFNRKDYVTLKTLEQAKIFLRLHKTTKSKDAKK